MNVAERSNDAGCIVLVPSYQPDERLIKLCDSLSQAGIKDVVIVDDGSEESYQEIFNLIKKDYRYTVLHNAVNLGKGRALKHGFNYVLWEYRNAVGVVTADSDGQHSVKDILRCYEAMVDNPKKLILGCRTLVGGVPWKSKIGNNLTRIVFQYLCGLKISDTQTGLRGIPREFIKTILATPGEKFEYETNVLLESKDKLEIIEVPIETVYDSKENHQTHFDPLRDSIMIYKVIISYSLTSLISMIVDFVVFAFATGFGLNIGVAIALARCASSILNFTINRKAVFKSDGNLKIQFIKYILLVICSGFLSATLITFFSELLPVEVIVIKAIVETGLFFINYIVQRAFIFNKNQGGA